ncbi:MAG: hypothetical protein Q9180_007475, partial [Flavoplaca navasiana]
MEAAKSFERIDVENFGSRKAKAAATNSAAQHVAAEIIYMKTTAVVEVAKAVAEMAVVEDEEILER